MRAFASRGLIERFEAREMLAFKHSGFSLNADVERLLRYCARPPFALERPCRSVSRAPRMARQAQHQDQVKPSVRGGAG